MKAYHSSLIGLLILLGNLSYVCAQGAENPTGKAILMDRASEVTHNQPWLHQILQNRISLEENQTYTLTFWAKTDSPQQIQISSKNSQPPWAANGLKENVDVTTEWQKFEINFEANEHTLPGETRLTFNYVESAPGKIWIADVNLRAVDSDENLIANPRFEDGLAPWSHEGTQSGELEVHIVDVDE